MIAKALNHIFEAGCWIAEWTPFTRIGRELAKWAARMEARRAVR